ncbi:hypothetical protein [Acidovorax sp. HMWF018]|jgi:hypothetical protein|uniref:hypothetical protein n=1 Tax=Acidovorax sp. HMWF018 TaxID=2056855 RepID=UPI0011B29FDE|nr:hypothetical protein [Acidovorax sp. HMWF018]
MRIASVIAVLALFLSGCAYNVKPASVGTVNIHTSYDTKVPGRWVAVMDDGLKNVSKQVRPSSHVCSAHNYPVSLDDSLVSSLRRVYEQIFENVEVRPVAPTIETLQRDSLNGVITTRLEEFSPRLSCQMGFWSGTCTSSGDIAVSVNIRGQSGTLFATSASGSRMAEGDSGGACEGGSTVLGEAVNKSMKDMLERLGERVSSSPRVREASK